MSANPVHYLPLTALWRLNQAVRPVAASFNAYGCYLVGSALERKDWRDVDVRLIMPPDKFAKTFATKRGRYLWTLVCVTVSEHLSSVTGLPIDFQPQSADDPDNLDRGYIHPLGKTAQSDHYSAAVPALAAHLEAEQPGGEMTKSSTHSDIPAESQDLVPLTLVPVEAFTGLCAHADCRDEDCVGYGICDAVSAWSDCNRAIGRIYRVDDTEPRYREPGDTVTVYAKASDKAWFERRFGDHLEAEQAEED